MRQILREAALRQSQTSVVAAETAANLMLALVEGRMHQFLRSRFQASPLQGWQDQWAVLEAGLFKDHS